MAMNWLKLVYDKQVPLGDAVLDVVVGFVLVLGVLILLIAIFWAFGKIMVALNNRGKEMPAAQSAVAPRVSVPAAAPVAPVAEEGISDEVVVVIAAAVAAMAPAGTTYAVRRIRREQSGRPVWAAAGVAENTRPF